MLHKAMVHDLVWCIVFDGERSVGARHDRACLGAVSSLERFPTARSYWRVQMCTATACGCTAVLACTTCALAKGGWVRWVRWTLVEICV